MMKREEKNDEEEGKRGKNVEEMLMSEFSILTWRGTQVEHGAALVQDPKLAVELDELEGRTGAVAVVVVVVELFFEEREKKG